MRTYFNQTFGDFKCVHCHNHVSADNLLSGVQNRNHCPYCLWSRHLDLYESGDRLAACKSPMKPVGLSLKKTKKKYGKDQGELMLVHLCEECGKVSVNRIAADDIADNIFEIYEQSLKMERATCALIEQGGVNILGECDLEIVEARLFGWEHTSSREQNPDSFCFEPA